MKRSFKNRSGINAFMTLPLFALLPFSQVILVSGTWVKGQVLQNTRKNPKGRLRQFQTGI